MPRAVSSRVNASSADIRSDMSSLMTRDTTFCPLKATLAASGDAQVEVILTAPSVAPAAKKVTRMNSGSSGRTGRVIEPPGASQGVIGPLYPTPSAGSPQVAHRQPRGRRGGPYPRADQRRVDWSDWSILVLWIRTRL